MSFNSRAFEERGSSSVEDEEIKSVCSLAHKKVSEMLRSTPVLDSWNVLQNEGRGYLT
jgi:hypothetical protein